MIKSISTFTYMAWNDDKYKITFKLVISHWTNEMSFSTHLQILFSSEYFLFFPVALRPNAGRGLLIL